MDWEKIVLDELDGLYVLEIIFRTAVMFTVILVVLRLSGKRGIRQLSIFELAIIIGLGSAVGDSMFYEDVGILTAVIVCFTAIGLYRGITWLTTKNERIEKALEGRPMYIVEDSVITVKDDSKDSLSKYEFFAELREKGVEHLGQVRVAILETDGSISVFFFPNEEVKHGLPILPKAYNKNTAVITDEDLYACIYCGTVHRLQTGRHECKRCQHHEWVKAIDTKRIN
ncbi:DUF421 domain-containing protein [Parapedobacter pyrenivorans]|uniref:DUF421 domain-containing protein n=1 Tax=Parapedobacter pyrenivorans TaxID=1305674 RepID=A0A917I3L5_9SPHI|nr:YetF domain-containing protein [Parapedobacter pyrenivorans]GGH04337.1 DUF421 domain-containing protein [Parapedobacter pyrenivorans]